jgi:formylglycine-generating enzyme required for sulfatase activity
MSPKHVFISYSSKDQSIAFEICRLLESQGLQCWIAPRDVRPGYDYDEEIIDAIDAVEAMVLILSAHSNASIHVKHEVEYAVSHGKAVFPVRIQEVLPSKKLVLHISTKHWLDAWKPPLEAKIEQLAAAIKGLLGLLEFSEIEVPPVRQPPVTPIAVPPAAPVQSPTKESAVGRKTDVVATDLNVQTTTKEFTVDLGNGVKLEMVELPGGTFLMGSPEEEENRLRFEGPQHQVTVSAFAIGKYEVTQAQWQAVMGNNPSKFIGDDLPVEQVSWESAQEFCGRLSQRTGQTYRLPTEAEWEYACRAGTTGAYAGTLEEMAWYGGNSGGKTHVVGQKQPNAWGLYDMHENVWEWCQDWFDGDYYSQSPAIDPQGPGLSSNLSRVRRGGGWLAFAGEDDCRSASRNNFGPCYHNSSIGFRLVRTAR